MITNTPAFIQASQDKRWDNTALLHYCLSDKVSVSVDKVLEKDHTPLSYADTILTPHGSDLCDALFYDYLEREDIPFQLISAWMFDHLAITAALIRIMAVRPGNLDDATTLVACAGSYLLMIDSPAAESNFSGLASYSDIAINFINSYPQAYSGLHKNTILQLITCVSQIDGPEWLFHRPAWRKVFVKYPNRLKLLRTFLHMALVSYVMDDDALDASFTIGRETLFSLMQDFIDLRLQTKQTQKEILAFCHRLQIHCDLPNKNIFFESLLKESFSAFSQHHYQQFGDQFVKTPAPKPDVKVSFQQP